MVLLGMMLLQTLRALRGIGEEVWTWKNEWRWLYHLNCKMTIEFLFMQNSHFTI